MFGSNKRYLSISINEAIIKIAQVKSSGVVEKVARASATDATSQDEMTKVLKALLNNFNRRSPVVLAIPASCSTSKNIEVPSADPNEIRSIINLQASRHTPYSREEVLIGYINLGGSTGTTNVLLVIVHRNVIKDRLDILSKCGLTPEKVLFIPEGIGRLYAKGLNLKKEAVPVGVIDFTVNFTNFLIVARGCVVFSRSIPMGIKNLLEDNTGSSKIAEELGKTLAAYQSEDIDPTPASFVVTTDNEAVKNILPLLEEALKIPVTLSPYVNFVKANSVKNKLKKDFADDSFLEVIAPVATLAKSDINLIPEEILMKRTVEQQKKEATKTGIGVVVIMAMLGFMMMSKIYFKDTFLTKNLREQFSTQKEEVQKLQERMAQTRIIREYLEGRMLTLDTIQELFRVTPAAIYLNNVVLEEDGSITLAGISQSMSQVFSYVKALDDSPMFMNAKTKSTSTKKEGTKDVAVFEVVLKLDDGHKE